MVCPLIPQKAEADPEYGGALLDGLRGKTSPGSARIPDGFDTCAMTATGLRSSPE
jgi:hypothetical protein